MKGVGLFVPFQLSLHFRPANHGPRKSNSFHNSIRLTNFNARSCNPLFLGDLKDAVVEIREFNN